MSRSYKKLPEAEIPKISFSSVMRTVVYVISPLMKNHYKINLIKKIFVVMIFVTMKKLVLHLNNFIINACDLGTDGVSTIMTLFPPEKKLGKNI
jgi:hypothetical protein